MEESNESDEKPLKEYEWARDHVPDDIIPRSNSNEFEEIWRRTQEE